MQLNENIKLLPETGVSIKKRVADFLNRAPDTTLIRLDQDLMNMPLPPKVTEEMKAAVDEVAAPFGVRLSSPWSGYESLKKAIAKHLGERGVQIPESDVFITSGLESAHACLAQLFGRDNNVLLPDPCERNLRELHHLLGHGVSFVRATPENNFVPLPDSTTEDLVYLASPSPVTGVAMDRESMEKWVNWANETGSVILHDASLSEYLRDENYPHSIYEIPGAKECAIELFSFEKGYGVRELKIAYAVIPATLMRCETRLRDLWCARQPATATPPGYVMQRAAELLISPEAREDTQKIIHRIKKVAKTLSQGLNAAGIPNAGSETSPYVWAQCPREMSAWQTFDLFLEEAGIVVTPGSLFGYGGERYFRLTAFGMPDEAAEAVEKIAMLCGARQEEAQGPSEEDVAAMLFSE